MFSKNDIDVSCAKSAQHRMGEDKPFRERAQRIRLSALEALWEQLAKLKKSGVH